MRRVDQLRVAARLVGAHKRFENREEVSLADDGEERIGLVHQHDPMLVAAALDSLGLNVVAQEVLEARAPFAERIDGARLVGDLEKRSFLFSDSRAE